MQRTPSLRATADAAAYRALQGVITRWHVADSVSDETHRLLTELRDAVLDAKSAVYGSVVDLREAVCE